MDWVGLGGVTMVWLRVRGERKMRDEHVGLI